MGTFMRPQAAQRLPRRLTQLVQVRTITATEQCAARRRVGPLPRRRKGKAADLYQLPSVVLDLDAEDSPLVRPYDEQDEADQAAQWAEMPALDAARKRITEFQQEMVEANQQARQTVSEPFGPWKVYDRDILSVALRGIPQVAPSPSDEPVRNRSATLQKVFERNAIPRRIAEEGESKSILLMLHRQELSEKLSPLPPAESGEASLLSPDVIQEFEAALSACQSFQELRRLVSGVSRTVSGCRLINGRASEICRLCLTLQDGSGGSNAEDVLALLNNLSINILSKHVELGEVLSHAGLRLASSTLQPQAIQYYLEIVLGNDGFKRPDSIQEHLSAMVAALTGGAGEAATSRRAWHKTIRAELLSVLTGRNAITSTFQPSFRTTIGDAESFLEPYSSYITLLGELGALRMLWHEWRTLSKAPRNWGSLARRLQGKAREKLFVMAIARSERLMRHQPDLFLHENFHAATGDYASDALLDVEHIGRPAPQAHSQDNSGVLSSHQTLDASSDGLGEIRIYPAFSAGALAALESPSVAEGMQAFRRLLSNPG